MTKAHQKCVKCVSETCSEQQEHKSIQTYYEFVSFNHSWKLAMQHVGRAKLHTSKVNVLK